MDRGIQAHNTAHAGAADGGTFPERNGAVLPVDHGLDLMDDPLHGLFAPGLKLSKVTHRRIRQVFTEPLVTLMAALDAHNDQLLGPAFQEFLHTPGFSVGGIFVGEQVMPIKKVHDRIPRIGVKISVRQVDMQWAVLPLGGIYKIALDDHKQLPFTKKRPADGRPTNSV